MPKSDIMATTPEQSTSAPASVSVSATAPATPRRSGYGRGRYPGPRPGTPTKLTPERQAKIADLISKGVPIQTAVVVCGIRMPAYYKWMERGKSEKDQGLSTIYTDFYDAIKKARADLEAELAQKWMEIGTQPKSRKVRTWKSYPVEKEDGSVEIVRYLEKEVEEEVGAGDWQATAEFLSRRYPENWSKKESVEVSGPDGKPLQVRVETASIDQFDLLVTKLADIFGKTEVEVKRELIKLLESQSQLQLQVDAIDLGEDDYRFDADSGTDSDTDSAAPQMVMMPTYFKPKSKLPIRPRQKSASTTIDVTALNKIR